MNHDLLVRFLRQRRELGERELYLHDLSAGEALAMLREPPRSYPAAVAGTGAAPLSAVSAADLAAPVPDASPALAALRAEALACTRCRLCETRTSVVFGEGHAAARLVVVGEAPGAEEDRSGRPFVGRAGKLLDQLLLSVGFPREQVFICNVLKCRPPDNRNPLPEEVAQCAPFLHGQLEEIRPGALLAVGKFAAQTLLATEESIGALRQRIHSYRGIPLIATYHPAFLLRSPQWIRPVWHDLQLLRQVLDEQA
jgi:uracil-DNA glycosylase